MDADQLIESDKTFPMDLGCNSKSYDRLRARENAWNKVVVEVGCPYVKIIFCNISFVFASYTTFSQNGLN